MRHAGKELGFSDKQTKTVCNFIRDWAAGKRGNIHTPSPDELPAGSGFMSRAEIDKFVKEAERREMERRMKMNGHLR